MSTNTAAESSPKRAFRLPRRKWPRRLTITAGVVLAMVVLLLLVVSPIATWVANRKLAQMEAHIGRVESVKVALWSGSIVVTDFVLRDRAHPDAEPLVQIPRVTMNGALRPFLQGRLGGDTFIESPRFTIIKRRVFDGPVEAAQEVKEEVQESRQKAERWQAAMENVIPMEMRRVEMTDASVRFIDEVHEPRVDVGMQQIRVVATGLRTRPSPDETPLEVRINGVTTGNGQLAIYVRADPLADPVEFFSTFELKEMSLPPFNSFMRAYTGTDVSAGTFDLYMEVNAERGAYEGYIKPFFRDLNFENVGDDDKPLWDKVREGAVSAVSSLLENEETQKVATQTPFSGRFGENQVGLWETVENLWTNAFIRALREGLRGQSPSE